MARSPTLPHARLRHPVAARPSECQLRTALGPCGTGGDARVASEIVV